MYRIVIVSVLFICLSLQAGANNVRITKEVAIDNAKISGNIVTLDFSIAWDNSWRDEYNWDAVYVFLKFKKKSQLDWQPVLLMDKLHVLSNPDLDYWMGKSVATADVCQGMFIYRKTAGKGNLTTDVSLKWLITTNSTIQISDFQSGNIECLLSSIEMVYVPKGAFMIGDGLHVQKNGTSSNRLKSEYRTILPEWDLIKNDGKIKYEGSGRSTSEDHYKIYSPSNVANHVSETRSRAYSNAWYANTPAPYTWTVDFGTPKTVRWFGINGVYGYEQYCPTTWELWGMNDRNAVGTRLYSGTASDWVTNAYSSYPITKALKIDNPQPYRFYQIKTSNYQPMANNISMTEVDLDKMTDNLFVIDRQYPIYIDSEYGMSARTGLESKQTSPNWPALASSATALPQNYPTGFEGFYVMKYEITQEQYVRFLNTLQATQQRVRTIGDRLTTLDVGQYVFGSDPDIPNRRNGIIVGSKVDESVMFACNLNPNQPFYDEDDGQTLACNFLTPADMLAYADWAGLRPLSEMEYEKMSRAPYPAKSRLKEWAGGASGELKMPLNGSVVDGGTAKEVINNANLNAGGSSGNGVEGVSRVGSFAMNAANDPVKSGNSFWGIADLSGNTSEIYYNVLTNARNYFNYLLGAHGDGIIRAEAEGVNAGNTNMGTNIWPQGVGDFMLRGGNFNSPADEVAVSDRTYETYFSDLTRRDSTVSFRLGHSYSNLVTEQCTTYLKLQNGRVTTADNVAIDTVCSGEAYTIKGSTMLESSRLDGKEVIDQPKKYNGTCTYLWFIREHEVDNYHWRLLRGEHGRDLTFTDLRNDGNAGEGMRNVYVKRVAVTPTFSHETFYARLYVVNNSCEFNRLKDTIKSSNQSMGFYVATKVSSTFSWKWKSASTSAQPLQATTTGTEAFYAPERDQFNYLSGQNHTVLCDVRIMNKCRVLKELNVYVEDRPTVVALESDQITMKGEGSKETQCGAIMQDARDGNAYTTVQIGDQCWMAENLAYELEGYSMRLARDPKGKYGMMYTLTGSVIYNIVCPQGWKMPSNADYTTLKTFLNNQDGLNQSCRKMRAGTAWGLNKDFLGSNTSGFGAMGIGYYNANSRADLDYPTATYFLTSDGYYFSLSYNLNDMGAFTGASTAYWMAIRCIKK